jgi:Na+-driven multidrug efflux pump
VFKANHCNPIFSICTKEEYWLTLTMSLRLIVALLSRFNRGTVDSFCSIGTCARFARAFVSDPAVIAIAAQLLIIAGIFQLVDGVQVVGSGLLRGLRDTKVPMWINIVAYWVIALPLGGWLTFNRGDGAAGMWLGLAWGIAFASVFLVLRFMAKTRAA